MLPDAAAQDPSRHFPTLDLLHGAGDKGRSWLDRTPARGMADQHGVMIVSPAAGTSRHFDSPEDPGWKFETFVAPEPFGFIPSSPESISVIHGNE